MTDTRDFTTGEAAAYARGRRDGYAEVIRDYGAKWGALSGVEAAGLRAEHDRTRRAMDAAGGPEIGQGGRVCGLCGAYLPLRDYHTGAFIADHCAMIDCGGRAP